MEQAVRSGRVSRGPLHNQKKMINVQLLLHSLFLQVDVKLNDRLITLLLNTYL